MSTSGSPTHGYRLTDRHTGSAIFGLAAPQLALLTAGVVTVVLLPALTRSIAGLAAGAAVALVFAMAAFCPAGGRPLYVMLPVLARFTVRRLSGRSRWTAPLPLLTGSPATYSSNGSPGRKRAARGAAHLPRCLTGLELHAVARTEWAGAGQSLAPVGVIRDRRSGTLTVVLGVRGSQFSLLEPGAQHGRLADWGQLLSQFALVGAGAAERPPRLA
jgi:hypothetical protein